MGISPLMAQLPAGHPKIPGPSKPGSKEVSHQIGQSVSEPGSKPVPIRNFIDEFIFAKIKKDGIPHAGLCTDEEFIRRVHLDLTGRLPEPEAIRKFVADKDPAKREKSIDEIMATPMKGQILKLETPFLDRWTYFFGDLFRASTGEMDKGRNLFRDYIYLTLLDNVPYDQFVREMLTARSRSNWVDGPSNFLVRDHVDDFNDVKVNQEDSYDEIAITTSKVFLGINLECVSCHDGKAHLEKINLGLSHIDRQRVWKQGAFFSNLWIDRSYSIGQEMCLLDLGKGYNLSTRSVRRMPRYEAKVEPEFLLGGERPRPGEGWREAFARILTGHPQFARATVNLIWAELLGVGIVDPPFGFDLDRMDPANPPPSPWTVQPTHPELLEALAKDFRAHNFDLRYLIRLIVNSSTYQLSSHFEGDWKESYAPYFAKHYVRRLPAEMICDAISQATGIFDDIPVTYSDKKVTYAMQSYSPDDVTGPMRQLMQFLGQGNRDSMEKDTSGSMVQASALLNSKFVKERIKVQEKGRLFKLLNQNPPRSNDEIIEEVFLAFLGRFPRPSECKVALETLQERHSQGLEDLAWTLINKPDFILNH
jgi:Protein of unknown function (DUF1549)/Protein of unknown function (DUF1553)